MFFICVRVTDEEFNEMNRIVARGKCRYLKAVHDLMLYRVNDGWEGMVTSDIVEKAVIEALTNPPCGSSLLPKLLYIAEKNRLTKPFSNQPLKF